VTASLDSRAVERFHADLEAIPVLYADLPAVRTGIKGHRSGVRRPPATSRTPLSMEVVRLLDTGLKDPAQWRETDPRDRDVVDRWGVVPHVGLWVRMIAEKLDEVGEHPFSLGPDWCNLEALCHALKAATPWLIGQQWVTDLAADMHALRAEIEQALGIAPEFTPTCRSCAATLEAMDNGSWYTCPGCLRQYVVAADLKALGAAQYLRGEEVAQLLGVAWSTLRYWKREGWIRPVDYTSEGVALFDLDQCRVVRDTPSTARAVLGTETRKRRTP
jgi:MerR HTH family regulatory protein